MVYDDLPSGKRTNIANWKDPPYSDMLFMGRLTNFLWAILNICVTNYQRVTHHILFGAIGIDPRSGLISSRSQDEFGILRVADFAM